MVEIIVALALVAIVVGGSATLILSGNDIFKKNADMSHNFRLSQYTIDWLENNLMYASVITILDNTAEDELSSGDLAINIASNDEHKGHLMLYAQNEWVEVFTEGVYGESQIVIKPVKRGETLDFRVEVWNKEGKLLSNMLKTIVFPNNVSISDERTDLDSFFPIIKFEVDVSKPNIVIPEGEDPGGDDYENTPEQFYVGGDPDYVVETFSGFGEMYDTFFVPGSWGFNLPRGYVFYLDVNFLLSSGGTLLKGYYMVGASNGSIYAGTTMANYLNNSYDTLIKINENMDVASITAPTIGAAVGDIRYNNGNYYVCTEYVTSWSPALGSWQWPQVVF